MDNVQQPEVPAKASTGCVKMFFLAVVALGVAFGLGLLIDRLLSGS